MATTKKRVTKASKASAAERKKQEKIIVVRHAKLVKVVMFLGLIMFLVYLRHDFGIAAMGIKAVELLGDGLTDRLFPNFNIQG